MIIRLLRGLSELKFRLLGRAIIKDLPTEQFNSLMEVLVLDGWRQTYVYEGFDAWIDYGRVVLKKGSSKLIFEWDNWTEGSIEGSLEDIQSLADAHQLKVSHRWRWAD